MKKTFKLAAIAFSAFVLSSCGSGSKSDALLFGEIPGLLALLGAGITLLGVWYYARIEQRT